MEKVSAYTTAADASGEFQQDPAAPPTPYPAAFATMYQRELVHLVEHAGLLLDVGDENQIRKAIEKIGGGGGGFHAQKNHAINPSFDYWQRGLSFAGISSAAHTADTWVAFGDGGGLWWTAGQTGVCTVEREANSPVWGLGSVPDYTLKVTQTTAATQGGAAIAFRTEDYGAFMPERITLSFYARSEDLSDQPKLWGSVVAHPGSGTGNTWVGEPLEPDAIQLDTNWTRYSLTFQTGPRLDFGDDAFVQFAIVATDAILGSTWELGDAQVELSDIATPFAKLPPALALERCRRRFEKTYPVDMPPGTDTTLAPNAAGRCPATWHVQNTDEFWGHNARFKVSKRTTPTVVWYSIDGTPNSVDFGGAAVSWPSAVTGQSTETPETPGIASVASNHTEDIPGQAHYTADADLPLEPAEGTVSGTWTPAT